jgi:hypothetical protein
MEKLYNGRLPGSLRRWKTRRPAICTRADGEGEGEDDEDTQTRFFPRFPARLPEPAAFTPRKPGSSGG